MEWVLLGSKRAVQKDETLKGSRRQKGLTLQEFPGVLATGRISISNETGSEGRGGV